ncbi:alpha/beta fold hydrolase [Micromonospora sp. 15K316]|uniref:alpha/beta fold hydrolase n=1 Tax=Micromonospora sp. 15K316 TaxID=2530376 RepID=UPI00140457F9|nr:alpha/beta hydrolase [Micromonospora sp. 15K316]
MQQRIEHHRATVDGVAHHYLIAGDGPTLLLIHGFPQTSREWTPLIERLAPRFRVVAPDLRGLGGFPGPAGGYDKMTLAADVHGIVEQADADGPVLICGHDMGAYVGFAYALSYRDEVAGLVTVDAPLPGTALGDSLSTNPRTWHIPFHSNVDVAHLLISGREREYIDYFVSSRSYDRSAITPEDIDSYAAAYRAPGALRAGLEMYRSLAQDSTDNKAALSKGRLSVPVVVVASGVTAVPDALEAMAGEIAEHPRVEIVAQAGHWIPEEKPDELARIITDLAGGTTEAAR